MEADEGNEGRGGSGVGLVEWAEDVSDGYASLHSWTGELFEVRRTRNEEEKEKKPHAPPRFEQVRTLQRRSRAVYNDDDTDQSRRRE